MVCKGSAVNALIEQTELVELVRNCFFEQPTREKILALEAALMQLPQADIPLRHYFANGVYGRAITMPQGALIVGKLHKKEHLCIVASGEVSVLTEQGPTRLKAGEVFASYPGTKRVLYAHEETVWVTVHPNPMNERDTDRLETDYIAATYAELDGVVMEIPRLEHEGEPCRL